MVDVSGIFNLFGGRVRDGFAPRDFFTRDHLTKLISEGSKAMRSVSHSSQGEPSYTDSVQKDWWVPVHKWNEMGHG